MWIAEKAAEFWTVMQLPSGMSILTPAVPNAEPIAVFLNLVEEHKKLQAQQRNPAVVTRFEISFLVLLF